MIEKTQPLRPVQVFMNTDAFIGFPPQRGGGGSQRDFFVGDDEGFVRHKQIMKESVAGVSDAIRRRRERVNFVHVQMREDALAKSHRPVDRLFTPQGGFGLVAGGRAGELVFQCTPQGLDGLLLTIDTAEDHPRIAQNKQTGEQELRVSEYRSELGAIESLRLHGREDRIRFSSEEAVRAVAQKNAIGSYIVELFQQDYSTASPEDLASAIQQLERSFDRIGGGLLVKPFLPARLRRPGARSSMALSVRLLSDPSRRLISLPGILQPQLLTHEGPTRDIFTDASTDLDGARHANFLDVIADQSLVRAGQLPLIISEAPAEPIILVDAPSMPIPSKGNDYPVVGVIDGGVSDCAILTPWRVGSGGLIPAADRNERHGTFIAGLVAGGAALNPGLATCLEPIGVKYFDLDIMPRRELRSQYYADADLFFDQLDESVAAARRDHQVRIFNFSFAMGDPRPGAYSLYAEYFDEIALKHNVIFVIPSGNLPVGQERPTWSRNGQEVVQMLAGQSGVQTITPPAEQFFGLTVGALNPPQVTGHAALLPTTYTRRGPGTGGARKPDLSHVGGVSVGSAANNRTGLASVMPNGKMSESCGTSYAAPLVAATLATLDHRLERQAGRELLTSLVVHRAERAAELLKPGVRHVAHEFVGFGLPPQADAILADDNHGITLVFSESLPNRKVLDFPFAWPAVLTDSDGGCRGRVELTLAYTPPVDRNFEEEALRIELEARLRQEAVDPDTGEYEWADQLDHDCSGVPQGMQKREKYLLRMGLKWSPIKKYRANMRGKGKSANWRLVIESVARAGANYPDIGIPFAAILTISDPKRETPVYDQMRNHLLSRGLALADIQVAHRIRPRK